VNPPKLLDQVRRVLHLKHFSIRTEEAYTRWIKRFVIFHGKRHPSELGAQEIRAFLSHLATDGKVAAATQNQAFAALLFLYRDVLGMELGTIEDVVRARRPAKLPTVFTRGEVQAVLAQLKGTHWLAASLLYGSGLRLLECLRLRVKDLEFEAGQIIVRDGKGQKDRVTMLPTRLRGPLEDQLQRVRVLHQQDLQEGFGAVYLPHALARKYPGAPRSLT
jgi:integron integrase